VKEGKKKGERKGQDLAWNLGTLDPFSVAREEEEKGQRKREKKESPHRDRLPPPAGRPYAQEKVNRKKGEKKKSQQERRREGKGPQRIFAFLLSEIGLTFLRRLLAWAKGGEKEREKKNCEKRGEGGGGGAGSLFSLGTREEKTKEREGGGVRSLLAPQFLPC